MANALRCELGLELAVVEQLAHEIDGERLEIVNRALEEREPARLLLLDDGDLDAADLRELLASERARDDRVVAVRRDRFVEE